MANLKNITDLPVAESADGLNLIVNDNGSAKQIAASAVGAKSYNDLEDKPCYTEVDNEGNETVHKLDAKYLPDGIGGGSAEPDMVITVEKDSFNAGDYSEVAVIESGSAENVVAKLLSGQIPVIVYKHDKVYSGVRCIYACVAQAYDVSGNTLESCSFIHARYIIHVVFNSDGTLVSVVVSDI